MKRLGMFLLNWFFILTIPFWGGCLLLAAFFIEWYKGDRDCKKIVRGELMIGMNL
jgi:hypothetical protein